MTKLTAKEGYVFVLKDKSAVYDNVVYLSDIDSKDRYIEVTKEEGEEMKKKLEARYALPTDIVED